MKQKHGTLAALAIILSMSNPALIFANNIQRLIVDVGTNIGLWHAQVELFNTPPTDPSQVSYATNAFNAVIAIRGLLRGPLANIDLQAVLDQIARYPSATTSMSSAHRSSYVHGIYWLLRSRLSVLFLSTRGGTYASPNCDSAFLDVGYYLGRGQMGAFANNQYVVSNASSMILQAIRSGLDASQSCGCGFNLGDVWGALPIENARTTADFQALVTPIRGIAEIASQGFSENMPISPSSPQPGPVPPPPSPDPSDSIVGTWRMEDNSTLMFNRSENLIIGTIHNLTSVYSNLGYKEGMTYFRLSGGGQGVYTGQVITRDSGGNFTWKNCRVTINGSSATFSDLFDGGRVSYRATRIR